MIHGKIKTRKKSLFHPNVQNVQFSKADQEQKEKNRKGGSGVGEEAEEGQAETRTRLYPTASLEFSFA